MKVSPFLYLLFMFVCMSWSCQPSNEPAKELTTFFFLDDSSIFRKAHWGMKMSEIKKTEKKTPKFEDEGGLLYEYAIGNNRHIELAYTCIPTDSIQVLSAINVTLSYPNESDAITAYASIEQVFHKKYGISDGPSGQIIWQVPDPNSSKVTEIRLKLQKKEVLLSLSQF